MAKTDKKNRNGKSTGNENGLSPNPDKWKNIAITTAIAIYTLALFSRGINHEFVNWDDPSYITQNLLIRDFSVEGIKNILTTPVIGMYNPIPFLIYAFEYKFWGLDPKPYNWSNLLFHILATILLYKFIFRLTGKYLTAMIVALLFAIHPMHVSVVLWACQTKTSLYLIFYFFALTEYLEYAQGSYKIKYLVYAALLMILSALSKPTAVTLAPMLLLLDYYLERKIDKRLILEKLPFFAIALFFGVLTLLTHSDEGDSIFDVSQNYSLINNLLVSNYSIVFYIEKLFYPLQLSTIYAYPENAAFLPLRYYLAIPVIPLILLLVYKSGKFRKELIFGLLFFIIAISVLLRLVPSGFFGTANRYTYLSYTGLFFIMGQYFTYVMEYRFSYAARLKPYLVAVLCCFILFCTYRDTIRIKVWQNSITLFDDVIKKQPKLVLAYNQRAVAKRDAGDLHGAIEDLTKAIELDPSYADAYSNRGSFKDDLKDFEGALDDCNKALALDKKSSNAYCNRGNAWLHLKQMDKALADFDSSIQINPGNAIAFYNRGVARFIQRDSTGAFSDWKSANEMGITQAGKLIIQYAPGH